MPKSGEHKVNYIDSFFRQRPSINSVREGETISFLENGLHNVVLWASET